MKEDQEKVYNIEEYDPELVEVLEENIRTIFKIRQDAQQQCSFEQKLSDKITNTVGHISFLYLHLLVILVYTWLSASSASNL